MKLTELYKVAGLTAIFVNKLINSKNKKEHAVPTEHRGATSYHYYELNRTPVEADHDIGLKKEDIPNIYEDPSQKLVKGTEIDYNNNTYIPKTGSVMKLIELYEYMKTAAVAAPTGPVSATQESLGKLWEKLPGKYKVGLGVGAGVLGKNWYDDYKRQLAYAKVLRNMREQEEYRKQQNNYGVYNG